MSDTTFGFLVSIIAVLVAMIFCMVLFDPGHNMLLTWLNEVYQSGSGSRVALGL